MIKQAKFIYHLYGKTFEKKKKLIEEKVKKQEQALKSLNPTKKK